MIIQIGLAALVAGGLVLFVSAMARAGSREGSTAAVALQAVSAMVLAAVLALCAQTRAPEDLIVAIAWGVFAAVVILQVVIDLRTRTLPRRLSHAGLAVVLALMLVGGSPVDVMHMALGALLMTGITGVLVMISKGSLGIGDLHFSPLLGAAIGWYAPSLVILAWVVASVSAAVVVIGLLATGRITMRTRIPYGPFLALGTTTAICIGAVR